MRDARAREAIALDVYEPLVAYVAVLLLTFKIAPGEAAKDIVHDVLLTFYERWPRVGIGLTSRTELHAYLRTACRHRLIDRYRHERHADQLLNFLALKFSVAFREEVEVYRRLFVEEIIARLPPECAGLLRRYVEEDMSPAEMADSVQASAATFYSRWYRCLQRARDLFVQKAGVPDR